MFNYIQVASECIIMNTSRAYYKPCEIQSVVFAASFTAWEVIVIVVVTSVLVVEMLVIVVVEVVLVAVILAVELLTLAMRVDMLIIISNVAVDLFMDVVTDIMRGVLTNIGVVGMLVDVNVNVFAGVITDLAFAMPGPLEDFIC